MTEERRKDWEIELSQAVGLEELDAILERLFNERTITQREADELYDKYRDIAISNEQNYLTNLGFPPETEQYLMDFTSERDLEDRINRLNVDRETKARIYDVISRRITEPQMRMAQARGRAITAEEEAQTERQERAEYLSQKLSDVYNNPLISPQDLAGIRKGLAQQGEAFLSGESDDIIYRLANLQQQAAQRSAGEGQRAEALLAGMERREPEAELKLPEMPTARSVYEPFLKETGLARGTKLRSFIEREIPDIYRKTREARQSWWKRMHEPEPDLATFESEQARMGAEAQRWAEIAASAPSSQIAGGTYYGPGGLKGIAERAYQREMEAMGGISPEDYPSGVRREGFDIWGEPISTEDPFLAALRKRRFRQEYYRQPGAGLARRLTPAVRY